MFVCNFLILKCIEFSVENGFRIHYSHPKEYVISSVFVCNIFKFQRKNSVPVKEEVIIEVDEPPKKKRKEYGTIKNDCPARMSIRTIKVKFFFLSFF